MGTTIKIHKIEGIPTDIRSGDNGYKPQTALFAESWKIVRTMSREDKRKAIQTIINRIRSSYWL